MLLLITIAHIIIAILLVAFVMLQDPKGGVLGIGGGGGSQQFMSSTGATHIFTRITKYLAIGFAITSITLTYMTSKTGDSVTDDYVPPAATGTAAPGAAAEDAPAQAPAEQQQAPEKK